MLAVPALFAAVVAAPIGTFSDPVSASQARFGIEVDQQSLVPTAHQYARLDAEIPVLEDQSASSQGAPSSHSGSSSALYTLNEFMFQGVVNWGGYRFTYYSQQVLPGGGLAIPGRHINEGGYVADADGYIVLAGSAPKGTVYETPFGYQGKIYDRGTFGNHLDVYIR